MTPPSPEQRERKRDRERTARLRRAGNTVTMRDTLARLEGTVLAVRTLDDKVWERYLNPNALRVRGVLLLTKEAKALLDEQVHLRRLIREHQLSTSTITAMLSDHPSNDWERDVERWRALARQHFRPWSLEACQHEMDTALREISAFRWSMDKQTTGRRFLGWGDFRRVDAVCGVFQFEFHKVFRGFDMMNYVNVSWDVYTDAKTFQDVIIGSRFMGTHEVLQQLTPNLVIFRGSNRFPSIDGDMHGLSIVFRVRTERGFTQCVRSIRCPGLVDAFQGPNVVWASNFIWLVWEELDDKRGFSFRIGGSMRGIDITHMNQWMLEVFGVVLRSERLATGLQLLPNESTD